MLNHDPDMTVQDVMAFGKAITRKIRAAIAGLTKLLPSPPNICLTTTMAKAAPITTMYGGSDTGRFIARRRPVTTADRSPIVLFLFITLRQIYSKMMQDAIERRVINTARIPK